MARNQDDDVKNIAFLMNTAGEWTLAPAFDATYVRGALATSSALVTLPTRTASHLAVLPTPLGFDRCVSR